MFVIVEEAVAPVHHRLQGLLALSTSAASTAEECETVIQAFGEFVDRQRRQAGGSEFDREWDVVELSADVLDLGLAIVEAADACRCRPVEEQLDRRIVHVRDTPCPLTVDVECLS